MATIIRTQGLSNSPDLRVHLARRLTAALRRFENRITHTEVFVKEPAGGKRGLVKRVVIKVGLVGRQAVVVESSATNYFVAISVAARRCKRALKKKFKQPLGRRRDRTQRKATEFQSAAAAEFG